MTITNTRILIGVIAAMSLTSCLAETKAAPNGAADPSTHPIQTGPILPPYATNGDTMPIPPPELRDEMSNDAQRSAMREERREQAHASGMPASRHN